MVTTKVLKQFIAARNASTPLIAVLSADAGSTINSIVSCAATPTQYAGKDVALAGEGACIVQWDRMRGLTAVTSRGAEALKSISVLPTDMLNPADALVAAQRFPAGTLFFMHAMHLFVREPDVQQGIWNLRDVYKGDFRALVMLAPELELPALLKSDVVVLDEPLPTSTDLQEIVRSVFDGGGVKQPSAADMERAVDALCGLAAFPAEQVTAMALGEKGLDYAMLWESKRQSVAATHGLSVWAAEPVEIGGLDNAREFLLSIVDNFSCIVLLDEIEKLVAGAGTDTSGSTTKQVGSFLTWSSEKKLSGVLAMGVRGAGKTILAKWLAHASKKMLILMNIAAMEGSLVGESVANLEASFKVIDAISQSKPPLFIATTNNVEALSPELRRRFNLCTFFFDLPDAEERKAIWPIHLQSYKIADKALPSDEGWTGAEIESCCRLSQLSKRTLKQAAEYIVPVMRSSPESVDYMRSMAHGRYVSAARAGLYEYDKMKEAETQAARKFVRAVSVVAKPGEA